MKTMKRLSAMLLAMILMLSLGATASAATQTSVNTQGVPDYTENISINQASIDENATTYDQGREKMLSLGIPEELIDDMDPSHVESYADVSEAICTTQYVRTSYVLPNSVSTLSKTSPGNSLYISVPEDELDKLDTKTEFIDKETFDREAKMVNDMQENQESDIQPLNLEVTVPAYNNYLELKSMALKKDNGNYVVSGRYEWKTKPQGFQTNLRKDIFTIAPDNAAYFIPSTTYAIRKVSCTKGTMNQGKWTYTYPNYNKEFVGVNSVPYSDQGIGFDVPVYYSINTTNRIENYYSYMGYISSEMIPNNSATTVMRILVHYAQNRRGANVSFGVSIPKAASISITPTNYHDTPVSASLLFRHPSFTKI